MDYLERKRKREKNIKNSRAKQLQKHKLDADLKEIEKRRSSLVEQKS